jgi:hypothetical protein
VQCYPHEVQPRRLCRQIVSGLQVVTVRECSMIVMPPNNRYASNTSSFANLPAVSLCTSVQCFSYRSMRWLGIALFTQ